MKLFHSKTSPFVRKVVVLLMESGHLDEVELVPAMGTPLNSDNMPTDFNPLGKIPALEIEDGTVLYDSRVISRYFDARFEAGFYPECARVWQCLTLEALSDGMVDAAILMVYERRLRSEELVFEDIIEAQWSKVARGLDALESQWISYLSGPICAGQIALGCALSYLDFRHDAREWRSGRPALAAWEAEFSMRKSLRDTVPVE